MLQLPSFPGLPTSLLLLIASAPLSTLSIDAQWPYNLAPHVKYFPGDEPIIKRNVEIQERLQYQSPIALRKMDSDEGKMFFLEYWQFDTTHQIESRPVPSSMPGGGQAESEGALEAWTNASMEHPFQAPLARHFDPDEPVLLARRAGGLLSPLFQREFSCPSGTSSCADINRGDSCCPIGAVCQIVPNDGAGDVACCAEGQTCSGQVANCASGYQSCPGDAGGGCCVPGYACVGTVGCEYSKT